jgi:predicted Ser/Thr protein kinase
MQPDDIAFIKKETASGKNRFAKGRFDKEELANVKRIVIINENKVYVFDRKAKAE